MSPREDTYILILAKFATAAAQSQTPTSMLSNVTISLSTHLHDACIPGTADGDAVHIPMIGPLGGANYTQMDTTLNQVIWSLIPAEKNCHQLDAIAKKSSAAFERCVTRTVEIELNLSDSCRTPGPMMETNLSKRYRCMSAHGLPPTCWNWTSSAETWFNITFLDRTALSTTIPAFGSSHADCRSLVSAHFCRSSQIHSVSSESGKLPALSSL